MSDNRSIIDNEEEKFLQNLISSHWDYVEALLNKHGVIKEKIELVEFHYKTAFRHGWKHHKEYEQAKNNS